MNPVDSAKLCARLSLPLLLVSAACGDDSVGSDSATDSGSGSATASTGESPTSSTSPSTSSAASTTDSGGTESATGSSSTSTTSAETLTTTEAETATTSGSTTTTTGSTGGAAVCGDGIVGDGEACDEGEGNGASCCSEDCELLVDVVCRAGSGDSCDPEELCDGESPTCPDDLLSEAGTVCGDIPADVCLAPPSCTGVSGEACGEPLVDGELLCASASGCSPELACGDVDGQCSCALPPIEGPLSVVVIESGNPQQDMDENWVAMIDALGHTSTVSEQSILSSEEFFDGTDVLIVSSGVKSIPPQDIATLLAFVESGKGLYIQSEYLANYGGNIAFASVAQSLGADFTWTGTVTGQLNPVAVNGCLSGHDGCVGELPYFWYAQSGQSTAEGFEPFLDKGGKDIGFSYCPPDPEVGLVITTTDQDFLRSPNIEPVAVELIENILNRLARPAACKP